MAASISNADRRGLHTADPPAARAPDAAEPVAPPLAPSVDDSWVIATQDLANQELADQALAPEALALDEGAPGEDWVRAVYDEWVARLGASRMRGFLQRLDDQLRVLRHELDGRGYDSTIDRLAHDVASTAGAMGFTEVTRRCRALRGQPRDSDLAALAAALDAAHLRILQHLDLRPESAAA